MVEGDDVAVALGQTLGAYRHALTKPATSFRVRLND